jgi:hypothetical protein
MPADVLAGADLQVATARSLSAPACCGPLFQENPRPRRLEGVRLPWLLHALHAQAGLWVMRRLP